VTDAELDNLEGVALMADHGGRRWVHRRSDKGYPQTILREGDVVLVAECFEGPQYPPLFTDFITTFDPPTVLRLIAAARDRGITEP
jgi:hypothetical protein